MIANKTYANYDAHIYLIVEPKMNHIKHFNKFFLLFRCPWCWGSVVLCVYLFFSDSFIFFSLIFPPTIASEKNGRKRIHKDFHSFPLLCTLWFDLIRIIVLFSLCLPSDFFAALLVNKRNLIWPIVYLLITTELWHHIGKKHFSSKIGLVKINYVFLLYSWK